MPVVTNVLGTNGNDTLRSTGLVEMVDGGEGIDTLVFEEGTRGVSVNLKTGVMVDSFGRREKVGGVEIVVGTSMADKIVGSDGTDYLVGGGGNDSLYGGNGNDELYGGAGNDLLSGGTGSDYMMGGAGNDTFNGGAGFDTVDYGDDGGTMGIKLDMLTGKATDTYGDTDSFSSIERVKGSDFADQMLGSNGANRLESGAGNDTIDGRSGADFVSGGFGDDSLMGGAGIDTMVGGRGFDVIDGGTGSGDVVDYSQDGGWRGVSVNLTLGLADDSWGDSDALRNVENVVGTELADWIFGSRANNVLTGGAGDDTLFGGGGNDTFVFGAGHGHDRIEDFNAGDKLNLAALGFTSVDQVVAAGSGHDLGVLITTGADSSIVLVDVNVNSLATLGYVFA